MAILGVDVDISVVTFMAVERYLAVAYDPRRQQPTTTRVATKSVEHRSTDLPTCAYVTDFIDAVQQNERLAGH